VKVGDLVICKCNADVWYKNLPGIIVEIDFLKDVHVCYGEKIVRLGRSFIEVLEEA
jgi:hypothetical protein